MNIGISAMIKNGGYENLVIPTSMLKDLAEFIQKDGHVPVHTGKNSYDVVGFIVIGKQAGERVIILNKKGEDSK